MSVQTTVSLECCSFEKQETALLAHGTLQASLFRYRSGVCAVRLSNRRGNLVLLPYQGQQIWSMEFFGQPLAMKSVFDEPRPTLDYLSNYGAFLLHCGMTAMGNPGPEDRHPLHGELPNAPYRQACLRVGSDERGAYVEAGGAYRHSVAFGCDYVAEPVVRLYEDESTVSIRLEATNLKAAPLEYMYLAHVNFRPVDYGRLVYSAPNGADQVLVFADITDGVEAAQEVLEFKRKVAERPALMDVMDPEHDLRSELVMCYRYIADREGWAHSLHIQPDGYAGYIKHRPEELDQAVRWIVRNGAEEALGLALPATAAPEGYAAEKRKGNVRILAGGASVAFHLEAGLLPPDRVAAMERHIAGILSALQKGPGQASPKEALQ